MKKLTVVGLNGGEVFQDECLVSQYTIPSHALRTIVSYCDTYNLPYFIDDTFNYVDKNGVRRGYGYELMQLWQVIPNGNLSM